MRRLIVNSSEARQEISFSPGASLREIIERANLRVRSGCRGDGACGLCLVQIETGEVGAPTKNERLTLAPEQLVQNIRLACQITPESDLCVRLINPVPQPYWRELAPSDLPCAPSRLEASVSKELTDTPCGLAVDLGTTQIGLSLWDLKRGARICGRVGQNPQSIYGADVVTRLIAAGESLENAQRMARLPLEAVYRALAEMCAQERLDPREITRVTFVGNTAMLALLTEGDPRRLLNPQSWTRPLQCKIADPQAWASALGIHGGAAVEVIPPFAGFVGSDLMAGALATGLTAQPGSLLIDFGTNSEMALWDGSTLWVTSAAGGPAFESCGVQCGVPGESGAIYRFARASSEDPSGAGSAPLRLHFEVIGGVPAKGICGSGLVDLIAILRGAGHLTNTGSFARLEGGDGFVLQKENPPIRLIKKDVDVFQRAKAAIGTGIATLLSKARMRAADLNRICVCGAFGRSLDIGNAQLIGLLPNIAPERVELCGNTALSGCERLLVSPECAGPLASLQEKAVMVNLSQAENFDALFLENLYLQPLREERR